MKSFKNKKLLGFILIITLAIFVFGIYQVITVNRAHTTFENYYAFRGCVHLIKRTNDYGICKTTTGQTIKIVKYQDKWYLDGDLPCKQLFCM